MLVAALLAAVAAVQGQAVRLDVADAPGLQAVAATWDARTVPFVRDGDRWLTIIGVDLEAAPGEHFAEIEYRFEDGRTTTERVPVTVSSKAFPTTALEVEPRYVELSPEDQARAARESREIAAVYAALTEQRYWHGPFVVPVEGATGGRNFGHRRVFNGQPRAPHSGADLSAATGTPIRAANRGRVALAKDLFFSGKAVFLDHGLGVYSVYLHLSEILVEPGTIVESGAIVGLAGATGRVTGPHLHWGARVLDARVDPFTLLDLAGE